MNYNVVNARVTFRNSPIHVLERFTFRNLDNAYNQFMSHSDLEECVIIQTCNRVEIFGKAKELDLDRIKKTWASLAGLDENAFKENLEISKDHEALQHLLSLTCGLDSMVLGEEQILGQIKNSIIEAKKVRATGEHLNTLFDKAIKIGTRIRNSTGISKGGISLGSIAVKLAEENIDNLKDKRILLIGTGEISTLVAKSLSRRGYRFSVTSRTLERAKSFTEQMGGNAIKFEEILENFGTYDVIFVATTAPYFLVSFERMKESLKDRKGGVMILDLSNPRTVDEKIATLHGIKLLNLDQIAEMVDKNKRTRVNKAKIVEDIISEELPVLEASMKRLDAEPLVSDVFKNIESLREKELQKAFQMLGKIDSEKKKIIEDLTKAIVESIVSTPMNHTRKAAEQGDIETVNIMSKLFDYKKSD